MTRTTKSPWSIRLATGTAALAVAACVTALAAPQASATVTSITIAPGLSLGAHSYGTTCSYTVTAQVDDNSKTVYFYESGQGSTGFAQAQPANGIATATWTPSSTNVKYVYAFQPNATTAAAQPVDVGTGINLGSSCAAT
ncbi:hypothetical protein [Nocardia sp. NPDC051570]|uniref:hypothetical protein n=1 Tax=Nocardia sp. NPDC051570 TaxID=3364324 RepID=UPI00379A3210